MHTIYKYPLRLGVNTLSMHRDAQILCVQVQNGVPCLWAKVNTRNPEETRTLRTYGTGHEVPSDPTMLYIGTYQLLDGTVWHLFE